MIKIKWKALLVALLIPLAVGGLSALLTRNFTAFYEQIQKPALSPPAIVFPIVWTILYLLMGISSYLIYTSYAENKQEALTLYGIQLLLNFFWPILFFGLQAYLISFLWLILLWVVIILMIRQFYIAVPVAAYLQIPYLLWITFAGYLNLMIFLLN